MNINNHRIDELFARELGNIEIEPPQSVWQAIEKKLDEKKRVGLIYFRLRLAAGIALLVSLSGIYLYNTSAKQDIIIASTNEQQHSNPLPAEKNILHPITTPAKVLTSNKPKYNNTTNTQIQNKYAIGVSQMPSATDVNTTEQAIYISDARPEILENKENTVISNINNNPQAYLVPKSGIIAYNKPYSEPPVPKTNNTNREEYIETEAQYASLEPKVKINRWSIEGLAAPQYSYRTITSNSKINSDFDNNESGLISYSNAIKVNYAASKRFTIQAGIAYSTIGQTLNNIYIQQPVSNIETKYHTMSTNSRVNTSLGLINNNPEEPADDMDPEPALQFTFFNTIGDKKIYGDKNVEAAVTTKSEFSIIQRMQVIEIPVMARYYIVAGKINWHFAGGISTNILIGNDAILKNNGNSEKIGETENLKKVNYTGLVGTGLGYSIKHNLILMVEPTFKYYLNSISSGDTKVHPYSFGIYTGICYKL